MECNKGQIFGNRLSHVECVHVPDCGYVAKFLVDAADIIVENIDNEGVFRKSGAVSRQKEIKQQLESGNTGLVGANVHDVTALVKQFFRELPEPLFTSAYHDTFIRCYQLVNQDMSTRAVLLLCLLLPSEHLSTLRYIMKLLDQIAQHAEKNKMDSTNLAVVLAPNIMHVNSKTETMKSCEEKLLQECNKGQIFGNRLSHVECVHVPDCGYVAKFLVDAADIIVENIDNEGVFRKSGAVSRQKEIKQQLESGNTGLVGANVHDVTALVKQFFRELPEPLFTSAYHDTFIRCYQLVNQDMSTRAVLLLCLLLPSEHLSTLRYIMKLLDQIAQHAEKNKMDSTNLAVVLAPNIMHVNSKTETMKSCEEKLLQECNKGQIFGNRLSHVECVHVPDCGYVAKFLVDAADIIVENIDNEGVFRKSGAVSRQKEIKQQLESGNTGLVGANVHDVTALVKQFFRELPEPLFTSAYHDTFIRCYQLVNQDMSTRAVLLLCLLLPSEHLSTLRYIMKLLDQIAQHAEKNKMDSTNLAVVLAPNIMHVNSKTETMKSCEEKLLQVQTSVVEMLIQHAGDVGMVDDDIAEKTAFMSEVFNTDDELDASEDNLDDVRDTQKKEKKRKRSGSFQGFVSSIAQSITKWRKSTDGKTNTSGISQGSNMSHLSVHGGGHGHTSSKCEESSQQGPIYQFTATPVVRRKKTVPGTEGRAFSASKKKAILNQLPQQSTLAGTPFTPASGMKKMDIHSTKHGVHDTPSMPPRPYPTPRLSMKTPRKKLTLFSPASSTKKKRYSSSTNLSLNSAGKKIGKSKGIFRRLSGSKGDQAFPPQKSISGNQVGHRLASPSSSNANTSSVNKSTNKKITDESPIAAITHHSFSTSVSEQSIISNYEDERRSLNEGFIMTDEKEGDITRIMSEPAIAGSYQGGEYGSLNDVIGPDSSILAGNHQTPKGHSRSFSLDSTLDGSCRKASLKRGGPNSIKVGLLQGDQREVNKLRRSFGLDKSEMGSPCDMSASNLTDDCQSMQLDTSFDILGSDPKVEMEGDQGSALEATSNDSPGSVSRCKEIESKTVSSGYECDDELEAGFSTVSNGPTLFQPKQTLGFDGDISLEHNLSDAVRKTLAQQKQESKDSLLSGASSTVSIATSFREREMTRSISADSGKGSMCEDPHDESCNVTLDSVSIMESRESPVKSAVTVTEMVLDDGQTTVCPRTEVLDSDTSVEAAIEANLSDGSVLKSSLINKKSVSSHNLFRDNDTSEKTPTRVSRSKSLLENSVSQRKSNAKPNLQISAETHKLLARAGYIKEQKMDMPQAAFDDFVVPQSFPFIEQAENLNPRRESIIALQKNNAGKVRNNVQQFDRICESKKEEDEQHASPYRFPNSTSRKRGQTRLRIPCAFNKSDLQFSLNGSFLNRSTDKIMAGVAKVPISTNLIKPSDLDNKEKESGKSTGLSRKPSIYRADKGDSICLLNKSSNFSDSLSTTLKMNETTESVNKDEVSFDQLDDSVFTDSQKEKSNYLQCVTGDLDQSLQDTINDVCTPFREKVIQKSNINNKENTFNTDASDTDFLDMKMSLASTPISLGPVTLRTATNKTPVELFKAAKAERSPIKPLKRLGVSPHSPRSKVIRSPKRMTASSCTYLTTIPDQIEDLNNL